MALTLKLPYNISDENKDARLNAHPKPLNLINAKRTRAFHF